jgi:hypothetical protein
MTKQIYTNAFDAIRAGNSRGLCGIAYKNSHGWVLYDLTEGPADESEAPELLCLGLGKIPVPLSRMGELILHELLEEALQLVFKDRESRFDRYGHVATF